MTVSDSNNRKSIPHPTHKVGHLPGLQRIRNLGLLLFVVLFFVHVVVFGVFLWLEKDEARNMLASFADSIEQEKQPLNKTREDISFPHGYIVVQGEEKSDVQVGFYEKKIHGDDYLVYTKPGTKTVVAEPERNSQSEVYRFGVALAVLFFGETMLFVGWWFSVRKTLEEIFEVH